MIDSFSNMFCKICVCISVQQQQKPHPGSESLKQQISRHTQGGQIALPAIISSVGSGADNSIK